MFKSVQIKIILIITILAIVMFVIPGGIYLNYLSTLNDLNTINSVINIAQRVFIILAISFLLISTVIVIFSSKIILNPITKLIKSATMIADGKNIEQENVVSKEKKNKNDLDEISNAFNIVTSSLKENLNEVTRQKNQIETILLHMTDRDNCI